MDIHSYDHIIVAFSGGKDSIACLLHLKEIGADMGKVELWHHDVDGAEGSTLMDWPVTRSYCRAVAEAFGVPIYFSWKEGGFEREMLRDGQSTAPVWFEHPSGRDKAGGNSKRVGTRLKFPQVSADLRVRWCSAYLKIDVASIAINNQERFLGKRTLFISGERAQESSARAKYAEFEPHRCHGKKRHVDWWRPVHKWDETQVWEIIQRHKVQAHPGYHLGWSRLSCRFCIFGSPDQWASARELDAASFMPLVKYEQLFGVTMHRNETLMERADRGTAYEMDAFWKKAALADHFGLPIITDYWTLPSGAFKADKSGPV